MVYDANFELVVLVTNSRNWLKNLSNLLIGNCVFECEITFGNGNVNNLADDDSEAFFRLVKRIVAFFDESIILVRHKLL